MQSPRVLMITRFPPLLNMEMNLPDRGTASCEQKCVGAGWAVCALLQLLV